MNETGRRLLTAIALVPVVAVFVLVLPAVAFQAGLLVVVALGAFEWSRLVRLAPATLFAAGAAGSLGLALLAGAPPLRALAWIGIAWWLAAVAPGVGSGGPRGAPARAARGGGGGAGFAAVVRSREPGSVPSRAPGALAGWLVLVPAGAALAEVHARPGGPALAMTLLAVVWAADSAAWAVGRRFGRTRLAPRVSPGKTWEGLAGGMAAAAATGAAAAAWLELAPGRLLAAAVLAAGASVVGDLYESLGKRRAGVKDSGSLLPGHGGVLDRIDGLTAAAPVYAVATAW